MPADPGLNEHVWYDFPSMRELSAKLADALMQADPGSAATFRANAAAVCRPSSAALEKAEAAIRAKFAGVGVAVTEPVPLYLLDACGLDNRTPAAFSHAIEEGTGVPPRALNQMLGLVEGAEGRPARLQRADLQPGNRESSRRGAPARRCGRAGHRDAPARPGLSELDDRQCRRR